MVSSRVLVFGTPGSNFIIFGQVLMFFLPNRIFLINTLSIGFAATHRLRGTIHTESRDVLVNGFGLFWNVLLIKSSMQTALLRCGCLFLFLEDRGQSGTYTLRFIHHRWVKTPEKLCEAFSSSSEEHLPLHKFCFQNIYPPVFLHFLRRRTERISAFRYAFLSTLCGDIFVQKQRGNRKAE